MDNASRWRARRKQVSVPEGVWHPADPPFADRDLYLADPECMDTSVAGLLSEAYATQRRALIDPAREAPGPVASGDPFAFQQDAS